MSALDPANHRATAVEANHSTWKLLDGRTLSAVETDELLARAHAAAYHWARAAGAGPQNGAPASWPLSRRYAVAGHGELALNFADRCSEEIAAGALRDLDLAYAHESRARLILRSSSPTWLRDRGSVSSGVPDRIRHRQDSAHGRTRTAHARSS